MTRATLTTTLLAALAATASAQSINIDLNLVPGAYPTASYGASGKSGYWNDINNSTSATVNLATTSAPGLTSRTLTWDKSVATSNINDANTTGSAESLLDDGQFRTNAGKLIYTIKHLDAGAYAVFTYAGKPSSPASQCSVNVVGSSSLPQLVGGNVTNDLLMGVQVAVHVITIPADGTIQVEVSDSPSGFASCSGIQLEKLDSSRLRFYVDKSQTAHDELGDSWSYAFTDLQNVLRNVALIGGASCEVWVKTGFYYTTTGSDRTASFVIPSGLELYGGFAGTESSLAQRTEPWFNITALSGSIGSSSAADNAYHVVDASNVTSTTILDGFTIANGYASGGGEDNKGAGLYARETHIRVANCKFISNHSTYEGGGALTTLYPRFDHCLFYKNDADRVGGGLYHESSGSAALYNTEFKGNQSIGGGGGVMIRFADSSFLNCLFSGNYSANVAGGNDGGALCVYGDSTDDSYITNCTFSLNHTGRTAGGIWAEGQAEVYLRNSILWGNIGDAAPTTVDAQWSKTSLAWLGKAYSCIQGQNANPNFVDADGPDNIPGTTDDDCHLDLPYSPCLEGGDASYLPLDFGDADADGSLLETYPIDLDGNPRVVYFAGNPNGNVDMGCYEVQWCPADFDESGFVDTDDFTAFVTAFEQGADNADFDQSGFVDTDDFTAFTLAFEQGC